MQRRDAGITRFLAGQQPRSGNFPSGILQISGASAGASHPLVGNHVFRQ